MRLLTYSIRQAMHLSTYLVLTSMLAACGELSYKRGGSQQDIERAHQACRGSGDQLATCLAEQGWQKPKVDAMDPLFATIEATDNRQETLRKPSPFIEVAPEKKPQNAAEVAVKNPPDSTRTTGSTAQQASANSAPDTAAPHSTANDGPDVEYAINSWWKMGAFPQQLKQDQLACETKLGPAYLPDYKTQTYKRAFVVCMHDLGWMAIRNIK